MGIPCSTYRLQFRPEFGFDRAREILPYLFELGISHLYASPVFQARRGSSHGYDMVDPNVINPELGGRGAFQPLQEDLKTRGMGWIQDFVPNHMAFDKDNHMLMDVLEKKEKSRFYPVFDIDWVHPHEHFQNRVLAPFLGHFYSEALEHGNIQLYYNPSGLEIRYYERSFPVRLKSYDKVFLLNIHKLEEALGSTHPLLIKYIGAVELIRTLSRSDDPDQVRHQSSGHPKDILWELVDGNETIHNFLDDNLAYLNGDAGEGEGYDLLDEILSEQFFRLSFWKVASEEINYRRFFTINDMIAVRLEDQRVFHALHRLLGQLYKKGQIQGLRLDHIDGLFRPSQYLDKLRKAFPGLYLVVEKILEGRERLPSRWPVEGTTGYDFMNFVNGLFCDNSHETAFSKLYYKFTGIDTSFEALVLEKKKLILEKHLAGDVENLAYLMKRIASRDRYGRDITLNSLRKALIEVLAAFPVYRTYIDVDDYREEDKQTIQSAIRKAHAGRPDLFYELNFIDRFLCLGLLKDLRADEQALFWQFIRRFQQLSAPLMAKSFEDTVLYNYNRLISLNDVGSDPSRFGTSLRDVHEFIRSRAEDSPHSMNTLSTHDTKRGEDVRARINVLSEIPDEWKSTLQTFHRLNRARKKRFQGRSLPDRNDEYFIYQTLLGTWPSSGAIDEDDILRMKEYIIKAVREAKVYTAWIKPDTDYEAACLHFIDQILSERKGRGFREAFIPFQDKVRHFGMLNSLSQTLIKLTAPGVPDTYQGSELWDLNLVDPDNRRPVDYERRFRLLEKFKQEDAAGREKLLARLMDAPQDGGIKLFVIWKALQARRQWTELFEQGDYIPLETEGRDKDRIFAFVRKTGTAFAVTAVPRLLTPLIKPGQFPLGSAVWADTRIKIPPFLTGFSCRDAFSGQQLSLSGYLDAAEVFSRFPVALVLSA